MAAGGSNWSSDTAPTAASKGRGEGPEVLRSSGTRGAAEPSLQTPRPREVSGAMLHSGTLRAELEAAPSANPVPTQGIWPEQIKVVSPGSRGQKALKSNYATGTICCLAPSPPRARRAVLFPGRISSRGVPRQFSCCRQDSFSLGSLQAKFSGRSLNVQRRTDLKEKERASDL